LKIALYFDKDAQNTGLIQALGLRGIDAIGAWAVGMREQKDEEHLRKASALKRTLYSFNVRDFHRSHGEFLAQGRSHAGIILAKQQHYSVGEQMKRLLKLIATKPPEEMVNQLEFLSDWE
jgi:hypothetical protein